MEGFVYEKDELHKYSITRYLHFRVCVLCVLNELYSVVGSLQLYKSFTQMETM